MEGFDDIRPYRDDEVDAVLERLLNQRRVVDAAARFVAPRLHRALPLLADAVVGRYLRYRARGIHDIAAFQDILSQLFARMVRSTTAGFSISGLDALERGEPHLFVSNHRDIALDSAFMNFALWREGRPTSESAVGDNLFSDGFVSDLMRLNKSFVVTRSVEGPKAQYAAMLRTSSYIRNTLESGRSVWIAQREGRAKDGYDRTEPVIVKMFALAYRKEIESLGDWLGRISLVPVSVSYEIDPCASMKARELYVRSRDGAYKKPPHEDFESIRLGIVGFKGRVHLAFGERVEGEFQDADVLAAEIDRIIVSNLQVFPTNVFAADGDDAGMSDAVRTAFDASLESCSEAERPFLLMQYANVIANKRALGAA